MFLIKKQGADLGWRAGQHGGASVHHQAAALAHAGVDAANLDLVTGDEPVAQQRLQRVQLGEEDEVNIDGSLKSVIFQKEFSGILTGNLGKSYIYAKPVTEIMAPRFKVSLFLGLTGMLLSYLV